jgi:hypothetical protein
MLDRREDVANKMLAENALWMCDGFSRLRPRAQRDCVFEAG